MFLPSTVCPPQVRSIDVPRPPCAESSDEEAKKGQAFLG